MRRCRVIADLEACPLHVEYARKIIRVRAGGAGTVALAEWTERPHANCCAKTKIAQKGIYPFERFVIRTIRIVKYSESKLLSVRPIDARHNYPWSKFTRPWPWRDSWRSH